MHFPYLVTGDFQLPDAVSRGSARISAHRPVTTGPKRNWSLYLSESSSNVAHGNEGHHSLQGRKQSKHPAYVGNFPAVHNHALSIPYYRTHSCIRGAGQCARTAASHNR